MQRSDIEEPYAELGEEKGYVEADRPLLEEEKKLDVENQIPRRTEEQDANRSRTIAYLGMYFLMNLSLTFYNKLVLGKVRCLDLDSKGKG